MDVNPSRLRGITNSFCVDLCKIFIFDFLNIYHLAPQVLVLSTSIIAIIQLQYTYGVLILYIALIRYHMRQPHLTPASDESQIIASSAEYIKGILHLVYRLSITIHFFVILTFFKNFSKQYGFFFSIKV